LARPYDLDHHVQRVLETERRKREAPPKPTSQLSLFEIAPTIDRPIERHVTQAQLVVDDELLFSRAVHLHSALKSYCARRYAEIVGRVMGPSWKLWWIELFAGPGRLWVRDSGKFIPGSPVEALKVPRPFDGYVFSDLELACVESLKRRLAGQANVRVLHGDANSPELLARIARIVPKRGITVLYGDPAGLDLTWDTIKFFIDRYRHLDLLLNVPITGVVRALAAGYEQKAISLLGHPHPLELLNGTDARIIDKGDRIRDWYIRKLEAEGFTHVEAVTVRLRNGAELYDLVLASRAALAPRLFVEAIGEPMTSYIAENYGWV
jgi:three-Cys-motif partner protein